MVVGVDVYHDTKKKYHSVMGFVASINRWNFRSLVKLVTQVQSSDQCWCIDWFHWLNPFCCSTLTRWYSRVIFQTPNEELIGGFRICFVAALQKYYEVGGKKCILSGWTFGSVSRRYTPDSPAMHFCFWCRWTTTCQTRSWCTETVCRRGSWS